MTIRLATRHDVPQLKLVLDSIELVPSAMLDEMIADYFTNPASEDIWFTAVENDIPVSIGYCAPEKLTSGTYNLYAIGVRGDIQSKGIGSQMMNFIEQYLKEKDVRILIINTSGTDDFALTRKFYEKLGYNKEAVLRDFWDDGDDKVVYSKRLR